MTEPELDELARQYLEADREYQNAFASATAKKAELVSSQNELLGYQQTLADKDAMSRMQEKDQVQTVRIAARVQSEMRKAEDAWKVAEGAANSKKRERDRRWALLVSNSNPAASSAASPAEPQPPR